MAFQEKILEVQGLLDRVNQTLENQKTALNAVSEAIGKYAGKLPSDFINAQKEAIALSKAQQEEIKKLSLIEKEAETVKQKQIATQIKINQEKKSAIALSDAEARSQAKASAEANRTALANEKLNRAYVQLNMQRAAAMHKLQDLIASEKASNSEIRTAQKEFDRLDAKVRKANHAVGNFTSDVGKYKNALSGIGNLMGAFGIATGLYLAADVVRNIFETSKELQSLDLALRMVSGSQSEFASNQAYINSISEKWGLEVKSLTQQYTQFYTASKGLLSQKAIQETFEGIAKAGSIMGLSLEKQSDAFYAIDQMMSKGTVTAEELKKQLGNAMPGAIKAAAMAYMDLHPAIKTIQEAEKELYAAMKAGALDSATYVPLIVKNLNKIYGTDQIKKIQTLQAAQNRLLNSWTEMVRSINESDTSGAGAFFNFILGALNNITLTIAGLFKSERQLEKYYKSIGKSQGADYLKEVKTNFGQSGAEEMKAVEDEILARQRENIKNQQKIIELERLKRASMVGGNRALFHALTKKEEEALTSLGRSLEIVRLLKEKYLTSSEKINAVEKVGESEAQKKARLKAEKELQDTLEGFRKNAYDRELSDLERELEIIKDSFENKKNLGNDYIMYAFRMADKEQEIIDHKYTEEMRLAKKNGKSKEDILNLEKIATNKHYTDKENAYKKHLETLDKIKYDNKNGVTDTGPIADQETYGSGVFVLDSKRMEGAIEAWKKYKEGLDKSGEALKKLKDMLREFYQQTEGEFFSEIGFDKTFQMFLDLDEAGKSTFDKLMEAAKNSKEEFAVTFIAIAESAKEAFNFISSISQDNFQAEYDRLEQEKEAALRFAGENAAGRAEIERQYERKRQQIQRREAKAKRDQAIFGISIDTARAIMAFLAQGNWGMAIAAGILGGIQLAAVSSRDIPNFWTGTDDAPEGIAWTQERGQEIITDKKGRIKDMGDNKGPRLTYLNKGDKVIKNSETLDILSFNRSYARLMDSSGISSPVVQVSGGISSEEYMSGIERLEKVITDKPSFQFIDDERGRRLYREYRGERTQLINDRQNLISRDV